MVRAKKISSLSKIIREAVQEADLEEKLEAGFAMAVKPAIDAAVENLLDAIAQAAEKFEKHPQFGKYIDAYAIRNGGGGMWSDVRPKLQDGITNVVDKALDEFVENAMANDEDTFSNGDTYSTGGYDRVVRDREAYTAARRQRRY